MKKYIYKVFCFIAISIACSITIGYAQMPKPFERREMMLSPSEEFTNKIQFNTQNHLADIVFGISALYELQNRQGDFFRQDDSIVPDTAYRYRDHDIMMHYGQGKLSGDYLPYFGNAFNDAEVVASSTYGTSSFGTIYGRGSFSKGMHKNYGWNAVRHAPYYHPYLIADSTGGDFLYENYYLMGGYSFKIRNGYYGVSGSYRGEIASRQTDPRCANTTAWLTLGVSTAHLISSRHLLALQLRYIRNKQYVSVRNWRPNQQDRFFVTYGFGYYDLQESPVSFGISRMYYLRGINLQMAYTNRYASKPTPIQLTGKLDYTFHAMTTEERSVKNLYGANTHQLSTSVWTAFRASKRWHWDIGILAKIAHRQGKENIYESYRPDENYPSIYDFRLVKTHQRYQSVSSSNMIQGKGTFHIPTTGLKLEMMTGIGIDYESERNKEPIHSWHVLASYPMVGLGIQQSHRRFEWGINTSWTFRKPNHYSYDVESGKFRIDYQQTFLPYAYRTDQSVTIRNQAHITHRINDKGQRIGIALHYMIRRGHRPDDVFYKGTPTVQSSIISHPKEGRVKNTETWMNASLFYMF